MFSIDKTFPRYIFNNCFQQHTSQGIQNGPSKICGRQPLKNLKWYLEKIFKGCLPQILLPWPIVIINVNRPYVKLKQSVDAGVENKSNFLERNSERVLNPGNSSEYPCW